MNRALLLTLLVVLTASLSLNLYLWQRIETDELSNYLPESQQPLAFKNSETNDKAYANGAGQRTGLFSSSSGEATDKKRSESNSASAQASSNENRPSISELTALLNNGDLTTLGIELNRQLKASPSSEPLLLLEAELIRQTMPLSTALLHYYDLADLPLSKRTLVAITEKIRTLYQQAQQQLSNSQQWELVAKLNEPLFQRVPDNKAFTFNLATAYAHQTKITLMEDVLAALPFDDPDAQTIRDIAFQQQVSAKNSARDSAISTTKAPLFQDRGTVRVKLERVGNSYHVNTQALNQRTFMILDTGASTTAISSNLFARLGKMRNLTFIGIFNVQTASGSVEAPLVRIPEFMFAGYTFKDVSAIVLPEEALPGADGLLGMNILGEFDFSILPQESVLVLKKRRNEQD